jgi:hypothetical protein
MKLSGWLVAVVLGVLAFAVGLTLQLSGLPHLGLAVSMVGVIVAITGALLRPRRAR